MKTFEIFLNLKQKKNKKKTLKSGLKLNVRNRVENETKKLLFDKAFSELSSFNFFFYLISRSFFEEKLNN